MQGLYIHIPFCNSLCSFCDFPKRIGQKEELINEYLDKLISDLNNINSNLVFNTIYIGGGTPNSLSLKQLERLFETINKIKRVEDCEYSIECNPELVTKEQAYLFYKYGINRVSLGVQTFNERIGRIINRVSPFKIVQNAVFILKSNKISNINIDLIFGLPYESIEDVKEDLRLYFSLNLPHLSYYSLILEDKTVLSNKIDKKEIVLPVDDLCADMYQLIIKEAKSHGYHHYEISNFSKPGYESKHNMIYWNLGDYYGVGMSAASKIGYKRIYNSKLICDYLLNKNAEIVNLEPLEAKGEFFWLGLRLIDGVKIKEYNLMFGSDPFKDYPIDSLIKKGLLETDGIVIKLTPLGLEHGNYVFSEFI